MTELDKIDEYIDMVTENINYRQKWADVYEQELNILRENLADAIIERMTR